MNVRSVAAPGLPRASEARSGGRGEVTRAVEASGGDVSRASEASRGTRTRQSTLVRGLAPFVIGGAVLLAPTPPGLSANAWHFFALFLAPITGIITEPMPGAAVGLLGVLVATVFGLVRPAPAQATAWALSGFSNATVWLIVAAYMVACGYSNTG